MAGNCILDIAGIIDDLACIIEIMICGLLSEERFTVFPLGRGCLQDRAATNLTYDQRRSGRHVLNLREEASGQAIGRCVATTLPPLAFASRLPSLIRFFSVRGSTAATSPGNRCYPAGRSTRLRRSHPAFPLNGLGCTDQDIPDGMSLRGRR